MTTRNIWMAWTVWTSGFDFGPLKKTRDSVSIKLFDSLAKSRSEQLTVSASGRRNTETWKRRSRMAHIMHKNNILYRGSVLYTVCRIQSND